MNNRAVFLDRDGTINEERSFIHNMGRLVLIPGVSGAMLRLQEAGYKLVIVTNQSGVARGFFSERQLKRINGRLLRLLKRHGVRVDALYYCPYHPLSGLKRYRKDSPDRKPGSGMLKRAASQFGINLSRSFMVGDRLSDVAAGESAGCTSFLVRTGYGKQAEQQIKSSQYRSLQVVDSLVDAVDLILSSEVCDA